MEGPLDSSQSEKIMQRLVTAKCHSISVKVAMSMGAAALLYLLFYYLLNLDVFASLIFSFCLVIPAYIITDTSLTKVERSRILVIYILAFFVLFLLGRI